MLDDADNELEAHKLDAEDDRGDFERAAAEQNPNIITKAIINA